MRCLYILAIVVLVQISTSATSAAQTDANPHLPPAAINWPNFRFNAAHNGNQPFETILDTRTIRATGLQWQAELGGELVFFSSPVVVDGIVYIGEIDGTLFAYSADGCGSSICSQPLWQSTNLAQIIDTPAVANGIVYVGSQTDFNHANGRLNAFSAAGCGQTVCAPLWQGDAGLTGVPSSPTVWNGTVFVGSPDGKLFAFDANGCGQALCQPLWTGITGGGIESTPVVYKNTVFVGSDDNKLNAFPARGCGHATCAPRWTGTLHGSAFESSPAIANGLVYIGSDHSLSVFNAGGCGVQSCAPVWEAVDNNLFFGGSPALSNGLVYMPLESQINVYDAAGCGLATCNPKFVLFGTGSQSAIESSPTVANGVVYASRNTGELLAWPAQCSQQQCNQIWTGLADDPLFNSSPTVVNGKIYVGGSNHGFGGRLYVFGQQ